MSKHTTSKISRRALKQRLNSLDLNGRDVASRENDHDLAARLQSLVIGSSLNARQSPLRLIRGAGVLAGRVSTVGWIAAAIVLASVSLSSVNGLPEPLQVAMSNVLNVVGINVPHPSNEPARVRQGNIDPSVTTTVVP